MATNTQKEFRKQMRALAKEGKVSKNSGRRTVRFVEPKTIGFGAGTFLLIVMYNLISGLFYGVPVQTDPNYEVSVYDLAVQIDQRETQLIEEITKQLKAGKRFSSTELSTFKNEVNALRDELPSISEIQGAVSIENRQLDQLDVILQNLSASPVTKEQLEAINNAITIYNGLNISGEKPVDLVD